MPYHGNPSTDTNDAIRLLIGDTSTSTGTEIFQDAEIEFFAQQNSNVYLAASMAVSSVIGSDRGSSLASVVSKQVGDLKIEYGGGGAAEILTGHAKTLRMLGVRRVPPYAGGISRSDKRTQRLDPDRPLSWSVPPGIVVGWSSVEW